MGNCLASVFRRRNLRRHIVLILIGLDNAGKTKTVNNLAGEKDDKVLPTVGFKAVNLVHKDTPVTVYDLGGGPHFRQIWPQYYSEVHGVIFVIDSSDYSRLDECRTVLEEVLSHDKISGKPVLVLANKQDKSGALDDIDVVEKLNIEPLVNRYRCPTLVESYSAQLSENKSKKPKIDPGLRKGYQWLLNFIVKRYGDINLRVQTDIHADLERRKRMLNKASNTNSLSDDIATQTGFENPNFEHKNEKVFKQKNIDEKIFESKNFDDKTLTINSDKMDKGLIIVKPINNSVDSTITVESIDSESISVKPKLSPLFGRASHSTVETVRIELEPRNEFRKLSPIVKNKSGGNQHIDFMNRPQSSPTIKKKGSQNSSSNTEEMTSPLDKSYTSHNRTWDGQSRGRPAVIDVDVQREIILNDKDCHKSAHSDVTLAAAPTELSPRPASASQLVRRQLELGHVQRRRLSLRYSTKSAHSDVTLAAAPTELSPRPASASQLVRRQLELGHVQRRKLSLRYMHRNKTSPGRNSMLLYDKSQRHLDKGDFEHAATIN